MCCLLCGLRYILAGSYRPTALLGCERSDRSDRLFRSGNPSLIGGVSLFHFVSFVSVFAVVNQ